MSQEMSTDSESEQVKTRQQQHQPTDPPAYEPPALNAATKQRKKEYRDTSECAEFCFECTHCFGACHNNNSRSSHILGDTFLAGTLVMICGLCPWGAP